MEALAGRQARPCRTATDNVWCAVTCSHSRFPGSGTPLSVSHSLSLCVSLGFSGMFLHYDSNAFMI